MAKVKFDDFIKEHLSDEAIELIENTKLIEISNDNHHNQQNHGNGKVNLSSEQKTQIELRSDPKDSKIVITPEEINVQLTVSTKKTLMFFGGAVLMITGKLNPDLFEVLWTLFFSN